MKPSLVTARRTSDEESDMDADEYMEVRKGRAREREKKN